jgi:hypothetical protein
MTTENLQTIREAVTANGDSIILLIMPSGHFGQIFGNAPAQPQEERDLTVAQYQAKVEPDLSDSRIRELCAAGVFPDTTYAEGEVVPGAYKDSAGSWRITREGIVARQTLEREEGLRKRADAETAQADAEAIAAADGANEQHKPTREKARRPRSGTTKGHGARAQRAARPNRGNWKNLI